MAKSDEDIVNVIWSEDRCLRYRDNIGPFVGTSNGWRMHIGYEGTIKLAALCVVQADGVIIGGIKVDVKESRAVKGVWTTSRYEE